MEVPSPSLSSSSTTRNHSKPWTARHCGRYWGTIKYPRSLSLQHQDITCRSAHAGQRFDSFEVKTGVRQGCLLSAFLFLLCIDWIIRTSTSGKNSGIQWTLLTQFNNLGFVDGLALLLHNHSPTQDKTKRYSNRNRTQDQLEENRTDVDQHHCPNTSHSW